MKINDALSGILIGTFSAIIFVHAQSFPPMIGQDFGPNMFPQLIATGLMICAVMLIFRGLKTLRTIPWVTVPGWLRQGRITLGFLLVPIVLAFYVVVSESLGFLLTAVVLLLVLFWVFEVKARTAFLIAIIGALGIHTLFYQLLKVPLPWGLFESFAW
jgi:putative tricarboxylic transport membrane protein